MTTNEREAFENWARGTYGIERHHALTDQYAAIGVQCAWMAWQARAAVDQQQEVTDEMVEHAAKAYCESIKSSGPHEHQLQGIRAALQSVAQPVKVPAKKEPTICMFLLLVIGS